MHALKRETVGSGWKGLAGLSSLGDRFVMPRLLRKPARVAGRLVGGGYEPPRYAASVSALALCLSAFAYGSYVGGHFPAYVKAVTSRTGFAVDKVRITGNTETSEIDILERIGLDGWTSLIGFDADEARTRLTELPWVKAASVRKIYPDEIEVKLDERLPFAIWQHGSQLAVVERSGAVVVPFDGSRHATLPLIVGYGAPEKAAEFIDRIGRFPELASRVKGYIRVAGRRWDLRLDNGITVRLPEGGEDVALAELLRLQREEGLFSRDVVSVDLRQDDRLVLQLTPEAQKAREAVVKEQLKAARRRPGQNI